MAVVVLDVVVEDAKKLPTPCDQEMVQAFPAHGADPALGDGVGVRSLNRCADDLGAEPVPEVIEGSGELAGVVADEESDGGGLLIEHGDEVAGLLGDPGAGGVGGDTSEVDSSGVQLDEEQHLQPVQEHGVHGEEVAGEDAGCLPAQERPPGGGSRSRRRLETVRSGSGTLAMELAETWQPRCSSSPRMRWSPQRGFSVASRTIKVCSCWGTDGRPRACAGSSSVGAPCGGAIQAASGA
jgi:hypothetical protein